MGKNAVQKKKEKVTEDKTFGLKNKNRSTKVQAYVQSVKQQSNQKNPNDRKSAQELEARRRAKEEKKAREAEMAALFNNVDQQARKKKEEEEEAARQAEDGDYLVNPDEYLFRPEDFDDVERDDRRLEERLEAERDELQGRTDLTPVTEDSFQRWKAEKRQEAIDKEVARLRKAKAEGKLRGWDLWQMDHALFVDDDDADEFYERETQSEGGDHEEQFDLS